MNAEVRKGPVMNAEVNKEPVKAVPQSRPAYSARLVAAGVISDKEREELAALVEQSTRTRDGFSGPPPAVSEAVIRSHVSARWVPGLIIRIVKALIAEFSQKK